MTAKILVETAGPVTTLIINRPQAKNALDNEAARALGAAFKASEADPEAQVAVLTGAVGADEAISIGLATRKVARGTTRAEAERLALEIAGFPPIAMLSDRQSAYESLDRSQEAAVRREMELSLAARRQESQKGAARFA